MRKFTIVEIENSFMNFFTPAVLIAAGLFLFELFTWPFTFFRWIIYEAGINVDLNVLSAILANITGILVCLVIYFVFIPRLKVKNAQYKEPTLPNLLLIAPVFLGIIFVRIIITLIFEYFGTTIYLLPPWFMESYSQLIDPMIMIQFLIYQFIVIPIYAELLYRRTVIPLLEDRGMSPFLAVIISSLGFCLLYLPYYIHTSNYASIMFWFISTFLFGLATGLIYILTRNVLFSTLYAVLYYVYRLSGEIGGVFQNDLLISAHLILSGIILTIGLIPIIYIVWSLVPRKSSSQWVSIIKSPSAPKILRGLVGYFILSLILVIFQLLVPVIIDVYVPSDRLLIFLFYTLFYLVGFSIPFMLSITSEYAQY
ncbi:MAG: CPBP family intramembrane glutamic endopeptidase [Promethearchaeota archaeon]